jgi:hypothetical protein
MHFLYSWEPIRKLQRNRFLCVCGEAAQIQKANISQFSDGSFALKVCMISCWFVPFFIVLSSVHAKLRVIKYLSENSGGVRILSVCGSAAHTQNAVLL